MVVLILSSLCSADILPGTDTALYVMMLPGAARVRGRRTRADPGVVTIGLTESPDQSQRNHARFYSQRYPTPTHKHLNQISKQWGASGRTHGVWVDNEQ